MEWDGIDCRVLEEKSPKIGPKKEKEQTKKKLAMSPVSGRKTCVPAGEASVSKCNLTPALSWRLPCTRSSPQSWSPADTQKHHQYQDQILTFAKSSQKESESEMFC